MTFTDKVAYYLKSAPLRKSETQTSLSVHKQLINNLKNWNASHLIV